MFGTFENLVLEKVRRGEVTLVLGAGANAGSTNRRNDQILLGNQLAVKLAEMATIPYHGEDLAEVSTAVRHILGQESINKCLIEQFRFCKPSDHFQSLFNYTWKRLYTWNYDDALNEAAKYSEQRIQSYNGLRDAVEKLDQRANLQCVYLHGIVTQLDQGVILTREEYAQALQSGGHEWYRELAADYRSETVIFVGSSLSEPILEAEVARASSPENQFGGYSFLITPDALTPIKKSALESRKIIHVQSTLEGFVQWLTKEAGPKISPKDLIEKDRFFTEDNIALFTPDDVEVAHSLKPINAQELSASFANKPTQYEQAGRLFLKGFPISWQIAASRIPVELTQVSS